MTAGEKMVWAATFARKFIDEYEAEQRYGKHVYSHSTPTAIEWAWAAVTEMRESLPAVEAGWGADSDVAKCLKDMCEVFKPEEEPS